MIPSLLLLTLSPRLENDKFGAYAKFQEFHFELRLNDAQKAAYIERLKQDYAAGRLKNDIDSAPATIAKWSQGDYLTIWSTHSDLKKTDDIETSTEAMLNNGQIYGAGIYAQTRREARDGCVSSAYLLNQIREYAMLVRGDGNVYTSCFQKDLDASFEWTAIRLALVTGRKVWDGSETNRKQVRDGLLSAWDKASAKERDALQGWMRQNVMDWLVWRLADYQHFGRMTPYQKKEQLAQWGRDLMVAAPNLKPDFQKREKEFADYVKQMPEAELKAEFERMRKFNARFEAHMQKLQADQAGLAATVATMRKSMLEFHVANLNISENLGDTGRRWIIVP